MSSAGVTTTLDIEEVTGKYIPFVFDCEFGLNLLERLREDEFGLLSCQVVPATRH